MIIIVLAAPSITQSWNTASNGMCMVTVTPVAFGLYDQLGHKNLASVGMIQYQCTGTVRRLSISLTAGASGSFRTRKMGREPQAMIYNLYLDAAGTRIWGDGTGGSQAYIVDSPVSGRAVRIPVYGRLLRAQNATAGSYRDEVSVIVAY
jgi:spore coat protein U-like protein